MATLHQAIETTRAVLKWGGITLGTILLIFTLIRGGAFIKETFFPKPPPPPTIKFGKLPNISFPRTASSGKFAYSLSTVTGFLPTFPDRLNVYRISHEEPNLLDLRRARSVAYAIGVEAQDSKVSDTVYSWSIKENYSRKFVMDIVTRNFIYTTDFLSYQPLVQSRESIDESASIQAASRFLTTASSLPEDLDRTKTKTSLYKIQNGQLVTASNISETQIVRVDFFLNDIDKMPIYFDSPINSQINLLVSNFQNNSIVEANYYHHNITKVMATYPIKTAQEAYKELQDGKGYIAANFNKNLTKVPVRKVFLAYYLSDKKTDFLMPIIVFTDNDGFYAYVSAVEDNLLK